MLPTMANVHREYASDLVASPPPLSPLCKNENTHMSHLLRVERGVRFHSILSNPKRGVTKCKVSLNFIQNEALYTGKKTPSHSFDFDPVTLTDDHDPCDLNFDFVTLTLTLVTLTLDQIF